MIECHGWMLPDHEKHLQGWFDSPKSRIVLNGRIAYQGAKQVAALKHCRQFRTAVDVGGHCGLWSFNLAQAFDTVSAYEPVFAHRECFRVNVPQRNVFLSNLALGAVFGYVSMRTEDGSSGNTTVDGEGDIPMVTLDSRELKDVDLIKIDCEGFEENVLRGAVDTIERCWPTIIVEQKRDMASRFDLKPLGAVEFLKTLGYQVVEEISGDYIMVPA